MVRSLCNLQHNILIFVGIFLGICNILSTFVCNVICIPFIDFLNIFFDEGFINITLLFEIFFYFTVEFAH